MRKNTLEKLTNEKAIGLDKKLTNERPEDAAIPNVLSKCWDRQMLRHERIKSSDSP